MNLKQAKQLRKFARIATLQSPLLVEETDYQTSSNGVVRLRPACTKAVYRALKKKVSQ